MQTSDESREQFNKRLSDCVYDPSAGTRRVGLWLMPEALPGLPPTSGIHAGKPYFFTFWNGDQALNGRRRKAQGGLVH